MIRSNALVLILGATAAVSQRLNGVDVSTMNECILKCTTDATTAIGCRGIWDNTCYCGKVELQELSTSCVDTMCPAYLDWAREFRSRLCDVSHTSFSTASEAQSTTEGQPTTESQPTATFITGSSSSGNSSASNSAISSDLIPTTASTNSHSNVGALAGGVVGGISGAILLAGLVFFLTRRHFTRRQRNAASDAFCVDEEAAKPTPFTPMDDGSEADGLTSPKRQSTGYASPVNTTRSSSMVAISPLVVGTDGNLPASNAFGVPTHPVGADMGVTPGSADESKEQLVTAQVADTCATHNPSMHNAPIHNLPVHNPDFSVSAQGYVPTSRPTSRPTHAEDAEDAGVLPPMYNPRWAERQRAMGEGSVGGSMQTWR